MSYQAGSILDRLLDKVRVDWGSGCWEWLGARSGKGYGYLFSYKVKGITTNLYAHRFSYEYFRGKPIPEELEIDHKCRVKHCVNPDHLEIVPHAVNIERMIPFRAPRGFKTLRKYIGPLTKHGHFFSAVASKRRTKYGVKI